LSFACNPNIILPLTEQTVHDAFGPAVGGWLWRKLWYGKKKSRLHEKLEKLMKYARQNVQASQQILDAFEHDIKFHKQINNPCFQFSYTMILDETTKEAVRPLMTGFYEDLLAFGYPESIHGQPEKFDRDAFIGAFWKANPDLKVCPACDGFRPDKVDTKTYANADHFLPKSKYPFLSVHSANLVPLCIYCNRSFKSDRDPIDSQDNAPLTNSFFPYIRPAIDYIDVQVSRNEQGVKEICIIDIERNPSRRVRSLNRVFKLEERWPDRLKSEIERIRDELADWGRQLKRRGSQMEADDLRYDLSDILKERRSKIGRQPYYVLHTSYLNFAQSDKKEFEELLSQFLGE